MNVVIFARYGSYRYPGKHLHLIDGVPLLQAIIYRLKALPARVILATGGKIANRPIVDLALESGAEVYCEEEFPEWDLTSRIINMSRSLGADKFMNYSGDCPFVDLRFFPLLWDRLIVGDIDRVDPTASYSGAGMGERAFGGGTIAPWEMWDEFLDEGDIRREQPWHHLTKLHYDRAFVEIPWQDNLAHTSIKTSVDWPFEGAIADLIVRHLGHWPETDNEVYQAYREITKLEEG